ncbi:hypothetical protein FPRO06_12542 [Fusarium proliferatum]|uniref:Uncharacterized protein n=2 Tax=Gibberella intermedia TaxID=948311 RepID=A0A365NN87_GIBIN|nr:uncharacterized protein FPRO_14129 [Fusarium proliferatum ET1]KAG4293054.1 hypothetical protein FPRO06_12542 [Fusarium proliferatum]RBA22213.1 hypothetical protein FPRO05_00560 [Fusarium proliferatum]RKL25868.1 hypothetical protein BFJ72_g13986 [Fusarium proliferatum]CVL09949.1 uncharacterized protein FPRN_13507 [Fusarium proliferatum]CZR44374.1 uncharacterized protein FPRO_14129 [Fusarium proliferatum ET1]
MNPPRIPPVNVGIDERNWIDILRKINIIKNQVNFLGRMLLNRQETMRRCNPENTQRVMQAFADSRRPGDVVLQAQKTISSLMTAMTEREADARPRMYQLLNMAQQYRDRLQEEEQSCNDLMNRFLKQMEQDQTFYDAAKREADTLRRHIDDLEGELQRLERIRQAFAA